MFICEPCLEEKFDNWGTFRSAGRCECCRSMALCADITSKLLVKKQQRGGEAWLSGPLPIRVICKDGKRGTIEERGDAQSYVRLDNGRLLYLWHRDLKPETLPRSNEALIEAVKNMTDEERSRFVSANNPSSLGEHTILVGGFAPGNEVPNAREVELPRTDKARPHLIDGEFQSDKYPTTPRGKVPLSVKDPTAQDLLWSYAQRRRSVDAEFADDLEAALRTAGYVPFRAASPRKRDADEVAGRGLLTGTAASLEEEAGAIVRDVDEWLAVNGPVTPTHLVSVSARLKRALRLRTDSPQEIADWTAKDGRSNSSVLYLKLVQHVREMICDVRIGSDVESTARLVVSKLAHEHRLSPRSETPKKDSLQYEMDLEGAAANTREKITGWVERLIEECAVSDGTPAAYLSALKRVRDGLDEGDWIDWVVAQRGGEARPNTKGTEQ